MRIEMRVQITGTRNGKDWPTKGETVDLPDVEAADLIAAGIAKAVTDGDAEKPGRRGKSKPETPEGNAPAPETR